MSTEIKLKEIVTRINKHLRRFEADKEINKPNDYKQSPYYNAGAYVAGSYIKIGYVSYQERSTLRKPEAIAYLDWLDSGNVGRHYHRNW